MGGVDEVEDDVVIKDKLLTSSMVDESVLDEVLVQVQLVSAHHALFVLHDRSRLKVKAEWYLSKPKIILQPPTYAILFLVVNSKLVISTS